MTNAFTAATNSHVKFKALLQEIAVEHDHVWMQARLLALDREKNGRPQLELDSEDVTWALPAEGQSSVGEFQGSGGMPILTDGYLGNAFRYPLPIPHKPVLAAVSSMQLHGASHVVGKEYSDVDTPRALLNGATTPEEPHRGELEHDEDDVPARILSNKSARVCNQASIQSGMSEVDENNRAIGLDMLSRPSEDSDRRLEELLALSCDQRQLKFSKKKKEECAEFSSKGSKLGGKSSKSEFGSLQAEQSALLYNLDRDVLFRLQARLGVLDGTEVITARHLFYTVKSLGLDRFSEPQIEKLVMRIMRLTVEGDKEVLSSEDSDERPKMKRGFSLISTGISNTTRYSTDYKVPFKGLLHFLVAEEAPTLIGSDMESILHVVKEVLLSGDANRLVAELTSVRVDDLAAPLPRMDLETILEPIVGIAIVLNGVMIGMQTDGEWEEWKGWMWCESFFTVFFLLELLARIRMHGFREYYFGADRAWSYFDTIIVIAALFDSVMDLIFSSGHETATFTIIRTVRLTRLTRLFRIFRLGFLRELNVMVKGLFGGFRTLFWAFVLLFLAIYIIAVFATFTIGKEKDKDAFYTEELFSSLPRSMLTCFRCFVGDCTTSKGEPIVKLLTDYQGVSFVACYLCAFACVHFGLFNLIMALYVEITMAAAKRTEDLDKKRQARESLRVAHLTKKLLKKFCLAQNVSFSPKRSTTAHDVSRTMRETKHVDLNEDMTISKELFLLVVQDPEVQRLMNDLDIPPDRANLFDILDADGTGDLHVTELVYGLLKVRGEARKSDVIASLLAVRAVQDMIRFMEKKIVLNQESMMDHLGVMRKQTSRKKTIWDRAAESGFQKTYGSFDQVPGSSDSLKLPQKPKAKSLELAEASERQEVSGSRKIA